MEIEGPTLILETQDGVLFNLPFDVAQLSITLGHLVGDIGGEMRHIEIPLGNIDSKTLQVVIDYLNYYYDNWGRDNREEREITKEEIDFFDKYDIELIKHVTNAASFLNIEVLIETCCKYIAKIISGKTAEEIGEILGY